MLKFIVCVIKGKMHSLIGKQQKCVHSMCFLHRASGMHIQIKGLLSKNLAVHKFRVSKVVCFYIICVPIKTIVVLLSVLFIKGS